MTEVPKIVHQRLRAAELGAQAAQTHPEADVLAAFAEQALAASEREHVLTHLALCTDCRNAVLLALPAAEVAAVSQETETAAEAVAPVAQQPPWNWFAGFSTSNSRFARLRWAALAAGVAVALFVVHARLEYSGKPDRPAVVSQKAAPAEPAAQAASEVPAQSRPGGLRPTDTTPQSPSVRLSPTPAFKPSPAAKMTPSVATGSTAGNNAARLATAVKPAPGLSGSQSSGGQVTGQQAVAGMSAASSPIDATSSAPTLLAENSTASVEKAKPPLSETASETANMGVVTAQTPMQGSTVPAAPAASAQLSRKQGMQWRLAAGVLQRSLDGGQTWLPILQWEHPWLCYAARGRELWAGGPAGALQHSVDNGASWNVVAVSAQGQSLGGDVVHIEVLSASQIALTTATGETWTSSDGGETWVKK